MSVETRSCVVLKCDDCGDPLQSFEETILHFDTEQEAISSPWFDEGGWEKSDDGQVYCAECKWKHQPEEEDDE